MLKIDKGELKIFVFKYGESEELTNRFLAVRENFYCSDYYSYPDSAIHSRLIEYYHGNSTYDFALILIEDKGIDVARAVAGAINGLSWVFFGLFECVDDKVVFDALVEQIASFAKNRGLCEIKGPFDFNGIHGWSFLLSSNTSERWVGDPYHKTYYPKLFEKGGWTQVDKMYSCYASDNSLNYFVDYYKKVKDEFHAKGLRREVFGDRPFNEYMPSLITLVNSNFNSVENKHVRVEESLMKEELQKMSFFIKEPEWLMMFFIEEEMVGYNYGYVNFIDDLCNPDNKKTRPDISSRLKPMFNNKNFAMLSKVRDAYSKFILSHTYYYAATKYNNTLGGRRMLYDSHWGKVNLKQGVIVTQDYAAFSKKI